MTKGDDRPRTEGLKDILAIIENAKLNAYRAVNKELIKMYWTVGEYLSIKSAQSNYGDFFIDETAKFMKKNHPEIRGFNRRGLFRMRQFYETYRGNKKVSALLTQLNWTNHLLIISGVKNIEAKIFYVELCVREKYSSRELERQIQSAYYERCMLSTQKLLSANTPHNENVRFLDSYVLEFLNMPTDYKEKDLRKAIVGNLKEFILEFGKDFTFIGEEYRVQVGNSDFYIDLVFYNRELKCLAAIELKTGPFKPDHIGQMQFYLEALDRDVRKRDENPSIGLILCADKDDAVVEYTLAKSLTPSLIAAYELALPDKKLLQQRVRELALLANGHEK
jgi:predicted nuclease of restriction endonuclease-like (RecB) superfamily